jgi:hypothetical protein
MTGPALRGIAIEDAGGVSGGRENIGRDPDDGGVGGSGLPINGAATGFACGVAAPAFTSAFSVTCSGSDDAVVEEAAAS